MKTSITIIALCLPALLVAGLVMIGCAADAKPGSGANLTKSYPLDTCIVSGDKFGGDMGDPVVKVYNGREVKFCCKNCISKYEKNQDKYNALIDEAAKARSAEKDGK